MNNTSGHGSQMPPWPAGLEPKMTSGDFFKCFTQDNEAQDFMDASTSTPLETSTSSDAQTSGVAHTGVRGVFFLLQFNQSAFKLNFYT